MAIVSQNLTGNNLIRVVGAVVAAFSLVMGLLVLFVIPSTCSVLTSLEVLILGFLFIGGVLTFLLGLVLSRRKVKAK